MWIIWAVALFHCLASFSFGSDSLNFGRWEKRENGKYYSTNNNKLTWSDANHECELKSGKLITIENELSKKIAKSLIKGKGKQQYWIGLSEDIFKRWVWNKGHSPDLGFSNWEFGQPRSLSDDILCAVMNSNSRWEVADCTTKRQSVCQRHNNYDDDSDDDSGSGSQPTSKSTVEKSKPISPQVTNTREHNSTNNHPLNATLQFSNTNTSINVSRDNLTTNSNTNTSINASRDNLINNSKSDTSINVSRDNITTNSKPESSKTNVTYSEDEPVHLHKPDYPTLIPLDDSSKFQNSEVDIMTQVLEEFRNGKDYAEPITGTAKNTIPASTTSGKKILSILSARHGNPTIKTFHPATTKSQFSDALNSLDPSSNSDFRFHFDSNPISRDIKGGQITKTDNGEMCVFPFIYLGITHFDCIASLSKGKKWCATTNNFDRDLKWGFCEKVVNLQENLTNHDFNLNETEAVKTLNLSNVAILDQNIIEPYVIKNNSIVLKNTSNIDQVNQNKTEREHSTSNIASENSTSNTISEMNTQTDKSSGTINTTSLSENAMIITGDELEKINNGVAKVSNSTITNIKLGAPLVGATEKNLQDKQSSLEQSSAPLIGASEKNHLDREISLDQSGAPLVGTTEKNHLLADQQGTSEIDELLGEVLEQQGLSKQQQNQILSPKEEAKLTENKTATESTFSSTDTLETIDQAEKVILNVDKKLMPEDEKSEASLNTGKQISEHLRDRDNDKPKNTVHDNLITLHDQHLGNELNNVNTTQALKNVTSSNEQKNTLPNEMNATKVIDHNQVSDAVKQTSDGLTKNLTAATTSVLDSVGNLNPEGLSELYKNPAIDQKKLLENQNAAIGLNKWHFLDIDNFNGLSKYLNKTRHMKPHLVAGLVIPIMTDIPVSHDGKENETTTKTVLPELNTDNKEKTDEKTEENIQRKQNKDETILTYGGNSNNEPCEFPFIYDGDSYFYCINIGRKKPWCGTTENYDKTPLWGFCCFDKNCVKKSKTIKKIKKIKPNPPPFHQYHTPDSIQYPQPKHLQAENAPKRTYKKRVEKIKNSVQKVEKLEIEEVYNSDSDKRSRVLPTTSIHSGVKTYSGNSNGDKCVIPFIYNGKTHNTCIRRDDMTSWCATTKSFDKDLKWGKCCNESKCKKIW